ncbi:MAG: hypothetical protein N2442_06805 [Spirochaetes bacterium]|nr:hypothetical protein [Spirochaetota bacterium]
MPPPVMFLSDTGGLSHYILLGAERGIGKVCHHHPAFTSMDEDPIIALLFLFIETTIATQYCQ